MTTSSFFGARLLIPLFVIVAAGLAVHAFVTYRSTRQHFLSFVVGEADRSSGMIRRATQDAMLLHQLDDVQATIERLALEPEIEAIRLYDKRGRIALSSNRSEIGQRRALTAGPCRECHATARPAKHVARSMNDRLVRQLSAIETAPSCKAAGCHDVSEDQQVLGVLAVEMSLLPLDQALASSRSYLIWTTVVLVLVIGFITAVVGRRLLRYQQLSDWSHTLEEKVAEETAELHAAQRQVLHMEKMASLGKLSATVAHELNNPISGMLTYARLVERELEDQPLQDDVRQEIERYLHLVQRECTRCGGIVQNLLAFSRRSNTQLVTVDLNEVVERGLMLIRHHMEMKGVHVHSEPLRENPEIVADPADLEQALVALFVNAIEAMRTGGQLTVTLRGTATDVAIVVGDTGVGIATDVLPLIFEPFYSTKTNESGSGLGLAVVYGIVHRQGGTIEVESEVGVGTTFHVRLPRHPPGEQQSETNERSEQTAAAGVAE